MKQAKMLSDGNSSNAIFLNGTHHYSNYQLSPNFPFKYLIFHVFCVLGTATREVLNDYLPDVSEKVPLVRHILDVFNSFCGNITYIPFNADEIVENYLGEDLDSL